MRDPGVASRFSRVWRSAIRPRRAVARRTRGGVAPGTTCIFRRYRCITRCIT